MPVIERLAQAPAGRAGVSIDTRKARVAEPALQAGARGSSTTSAAFRHATPRSPAWWTSAGAHCCLMHMLGEPRTMQQDPRYDDVVSDVLARSWRSESRSPSGRAYPRSGSGSSPGIGFGKTLDHNLELLRRLDGFVAIGRPVVIGTSRKTFLGKITGRDEQAPAAGDDRHERDGGGSAAAQIFRVHDVASGGGMR